MKRNTAYILLAMCLGYAANANAVPFTITAQLTGDLRPQNPDGLVVDVTIVVDGNEADWTIDINSLLHPNIKLDEFYFNLAGNVTDYSFGSFNPADWAVISPATVQGAGGASFIFEALDQPGPPNAADVTNTQNLTFTMTKTSNITVNDFLDAPLATSNDAGSGQMGAHLQSLDGSCAGCNTDSGFAFGGYKDTTAEIPEPASLGLLGLGLLAMGVVRRRKVVQG